MTQINNILSALKKSIAANLSDSGFDSSKVQEWVGQFNETHKEELKQQIELEYNTSNFVSSRVEHLYLFTLLWKVIQFSPDFVIQLSEKALKDEKITWKQPWIELLEDQEKLEPVVRFFDENPRYDDKYFQEKMLYILSETDFDFGDKIVYFLNSKESILVQAAANVIHSQKRKTYYSLILSIFKSSTDTDIIIELAAIVSAWDQEYKQILNQKIQFLTERNSRYYADCIEELRDLINTTS